MPRIAFVTPGVLPLLSQKEGVVYGGSELRAWRFARGLADMGFDVAILASDDGVVSERVLGPVSVVAPRRNVSWSTRIRRAIGLNSELSAFPWQSIVADIYVAFGAAEYNASLGAWCRSSGYPFLLFAGSDADFSKEYRPGNTERNIWGSRCDRCYDSMRLATTLVVQSQTQRKLAKERFDRDADVVANPIELPAVPRDRIGEKFLWIGKAVKNKRPDLALKVAEACPQQAFVMILNDVGNGLYEEICAAKPPNVEVIASVRPSELGQYLAGARALLCTSDFEGFPNTFLDAGAMRVPVISLSVDPDGVVAREQGGFVAQGDLAELVSAVKRFAMNPETAQAAGKRFYDYVRRKHEISGRVEEVASILRRMMPVAASEAWP